MAEIHEELWYSLPNWRKVGCNGWVRGRQAGPPCGHITICVTGETLKSRSEQGVCGESIRSSWLTPTSPLPGYQATEGKQLFITLMAMLWLFCDNEEEEIEVVNQDR